MWIGVGLQSAVCFECVLFFEQIPMNYWRSFLHCLDRNGFWSFVRIVRLVRASKKAHANNAGATVLSSSASFLELKLVLPTMYMYFVSLVFRRGVKHVVDTGVDDADETARNSKIFLPSPQRINSPIRILCSVLYSTLETS